jgi:hypothetical protein
MKPAPTVSMELQTTRELLQQEPAAISMEPPARREAHSLEQTAPHCPKESKTCRMMPAPTVSMELQTTRELVQQDPAAISMEPPARREVRFFEPTDFRCSKESKTCQMKRLPKVQIEAQTLELPQQEPAAISMEPPAHREVRFFEPTALRCPKESKICQTMPAPTMPMEARTTQELVQQEPAAISMEPPARREAHSSEPTAPHCPKESMTCQMMPVPTMELPFESERAPRRSRSLRSQQSTHQGPLFAKRRTSSIFFHQISTAKRLIKS